jgi:hypothetical protein
MLIVIRWIIKQRVKNAEFMKNMLVVQSKAH